MVKDVTKFHKHHLGGQGLLECVYMCLLGFIQDFEFSDGEGDVQSLVLTWMGYIAHNI